MGRRQFYQCLQPTGDLDLEPTRSHSSLHEFDSGSAEVSKVFGPRVDLDINFDYFGFAVSTQRALRRREHRCAVWNAPPRPLCRAVGLEPRSRPPGIHGGTAHRMAPDFSPAAPRGGPALSRPVSADRRRPARRATGRWVPTPRPPSAPEAAACPSGAVRKTPSPGRPQSEVCPEVGQKL